MAISLPSMPYEIASVVSLPRNDIATQSLLGEECFLDLLTLNMLESLFQTFVNAFWRSEITVIEEVKI